MSRSLEDLRMSTTERTAARTPYLPPIAPDDLQRRNAAAIRVLDQFETDGDEEDQKETMKILRQALGPDRDISDRSAFR